MSRATPFSVWMALSLGLGLPGTAAPQDAVTLDALLEEASGVNPRLEALQASARAAELRIPLATILPDPSFQVGYMNLALPELSTTMAMSMAPSLQVMQSLPFPGKRRLRGEIATLEAAMAQAMVLEGWWQIRQRVGEVFFDLYEVDRRRAVQTRTLALLADLEAVAKALYGSGSGTQADVLLANVEHSRTEAALRRLGAQRAGIVARLAALLNRPPGAPIPSVVLPRLPVGLPDAEALTTWAAESRPLLDRGRTDVARADARVRLATREGWPDLMVGAQYGQRDRGEGTERMGGAMLGFSLPLFAGRRQGAERDAAEALARSVEADLSESRAEVAARILELSAAMRETETLIRLYRDEVLPQAMAARESALAAYRVGAVDFSTVLDAEVAVNRFELELHTLVHDYGTALLALEAQVGRELRETGSGFLEVS